MNVKRKYFSGECLTPTIDVDAVKAQRGILLQTCCHSVGGQVEVQFAVRQRIKAELLIRRAKHCCFLRSPDMSLLRNAHGIIRTTHAMNSGFVLKGHDAARWDVPVLGQPSNIPVTGYVLSHIMFSPLNAIPGEGCLQKSPVAPP